MERSQPGPPDDLLAEHAYLVARGVRALAIAGRCEAERLTMLRTATRLERVAEPGAIPFVIDREDGVADYGYAAGAWVIDLYTWLQRSDVPAEHRHRITGMLLGYSPAAIREHDEIGQGRRFEEPALDAGSDAPVSAAVEPTPWRRPAAS